jgi:SNF2 family DNA or RNA helicase
MASVQSVPVTANDSSALEHILEKLRPFQREAFDFATKGTTYRRQWESDDVSRTGKHQTESVDENSNLIGKGRILLADEMGLGKTVTSLAIMTYYMKEWPLLILCPASLRHT